MTREEFSTLCKGMKSVYADPKFIADKDAFDVWYALLGDLDYKTASQATQQYMMTERRIPTPADIREYAAKRTVKDQMNGNEAWSLVYKAICNSTYNSQKEFDKLPYLVQKAVGCAENLRQMAIDEEFNASVMQSHFIRVYNEEVRRDNEQQKIPEELRISNNERMMIDEKHNS